MGNGTRGSTLTNSHPQAVYAARTVRTGVAEVFVDN
jgi:hypothetical protein